jgi:arylsulfatase A
MGKLREKFNGISKMTAAMNRLCVLAYLTALLLPVTGAAREVNDRPNIILIFLDDSGYGDYEHHGNPTIRTPQITKLTQDGVSFSQFYVTAPACSASRYSLLTGRYPIRSGLGSWVIGPSALRHLHPRELTLAEGLKARGYQTGIFGKWHLGSPNKKNAMSSESLPLAHGFDEWEGTNVSHDYNNAMLLESDPSGQAPIDGYAIIAKNLPANQAICESLTQRSTQGTIDFIRRHKDQPFFVYVPYNMPHLGVYASKAFRGQSKRGLFGDAIEEIDAGVGQIRTVLDELKLTDNTIIIFSSDNGPWIHFQDTVDHPKYGEARLRIGYATPFRDGKGSTWEGGHRVAGIFCWPGTFRANVIERSAASTLDVLPTLFALAGVQLPKDRTIDGRDIRPALLPAQEAEQVPEQPFFYSAGDNRPSAIRSGPWKLHVRLHSQTGTTHGFTASREQPLLFQVEQDLGERFDRTAEQPERVAAMLQQLEAFERQADQEGTFWDVTPFVNGGENNRSAGATAQPAAESSL